MSVRPEQMSARWSVDFVEHLRTVHFALVTLATALLILVVGGRDEKVSRALTQATQIAELQEHWSQIRGKLYLQTAQHLNAPTTGLFVLALTRNARPTGLIPLNVRITEDEFVRYEQWKFLDRDVMDDAPPTLAKFATLWAALGQGVQVLVPDLSAAGGQWSCFAKVADVGEPLRLDTPAEDVLVEPECRASFSHPDKITALRTLDATFNPRR